MSPTRIDDWSDCLCPFCYLEEPVLTRIAQEFAGAVDPGHEVAGRIDAVGSGVVGWANGRRVGVGWHGGHCFHCEQCRRGDFAMCVNRKITGIDHDGGYAEYMIAPATSLAAIPDELPALSNIAHQR